MILVRNQRPKRARKSSNRPIDAMDYCILYFLAALATFVILVAFPLPIALFLILWPLFLLALALA